jgi:hypothetical protein
MINQGTHFIYDEIRYLSDHFILKHISYTIYYLKIKKHIKFANKVSGTLLTKLVNENKNDWDMNTYPQFYSHIKPPTMLEHVIHHYSLCMDYIHNCL